jgi:hypothetical protein
METGRCPVSMCGEGLCGTDEAYGRGLHCTLRMMALLDESGGVASAEVRGLHAPAIFSLTKALGQDQCIRGILYYFGWQMDLTGEHASAAGMYLEALERNKSDWRVLEQLSKLYLKVGVPVAALYYCELYHAALMEKTDLLEEDLLSRYAYIYLRTTIYILYYILIYYAPLYILYYILCTTIIL